MKKFYATPNKMNKIVTCSHMSPATIERGVM